jgi:hypothetical protein
MRRAGEPDRPVFASKPVGNERLRNARTVIGFLNGLSRSCEESILATMVLPLRELSVSVQREAVSAKEAYWKLAEEVAHRQGQIIVWIKTRTLNVSLGRLIDHQQSLIDRLNEAPTDQFPADVIGKLAGDLGNVVSLTHSFIDDAYEMPRECLEVWSDRLEKVSDLNSNLENYAESFRIASDETCTALLAELARNVAVEEAVPVA